MTSGEINPYFYHFNQYGIKVNNSNCKTRFQCSNPSLLRSRELSFMVDFCSLGATCEAHGPSTRRFFGLIWLEGRRQNFAACAVTLSRIVMKYHLATLRSSAKIQNWFCLLRNEKKLEMPFHFYPVNS